MKKFIILLAVFCVLGVGTYAQIQKDTITTDSLSSGGGGDGTTGGVSDCSPLSSTGAGKFWGYDNGSSCADWLTPSGSGDITAVGACTTGDCAVEGGNDMFPFIQEGTANTFETTFQVTDPTADRTITFPNLTGEVSLLGQDIAIGEVTFDPILESELTSLAELNTQLGAINVVDTGTRTDGNLCKWDNTGAEIDCDVGSLSSLNTALGSINVVDTGTLTDGQFCTWDNVGNEIDCNTTPGGSGDITAVGTCASGDCAVEGGNDMFPFIYEGTANTFETTFQTTDPTADRTITFPNVTGEVSLLGQTIGDAELVNNYSGVGACAANQVTTALNDNAAPTCTALTDSYIPDTITASNYCALSGGANCTMTGPVVIDDSSLQIQEGVDTMTITVPTLTAARAVTYPDAAGEVSLLGQTIAIGEVSFDPILETELDTIAELNTQIADATILTKSEKLSKCVTIENLVAADDNLLMASFFNAVTVTDVWCNYQGAAPTLAADISLEDGAGNAMTHTTPVCAAPGTAATAQAITAAGALTARETLRMDVDNTPNPATDTYMICFAYTID